MRGMARGSWVARTPEHQTVHHAFLLVGWSTTDSIPLGGVLCLYLWVLLPT